MNRTDSHFRSYLNQLSETPLLTPKQEVELAARIQQGDEDARLQMIQANLRLVVKIAYDYVDMGLPLEDLISEGNIGLMKAVERFDPEKGGKLSTYGAWWIKQCMRRALSQQSRTIRLPVHLKEKISKMRRIAESMEEELGREPTSEEISEVTGIDTRKLALLSESARHTASLDAPLGDEEADRKTLGDLVSDERVSQPDTSLSKKDLLAKLAPLLDQLSSREREIIDQRFGLSGSPTKTLAEVGVQFGVTRERIRQLQNVALDKMRRSLNRLEDANLAALFDLAGNLEDEDMNSDDDPAQANRSSLRCMGLN